MGTPQRIQTYMDKHRLTPLFEEMMNKVLHEQPDDPYVYLIKVLYKKAGLDIPADIKLGAVRKSSPERIGKRTKSPEPGRKSANWMSASIGMEIPQKWEKNDRSYDRPWLTNSKKPKPKSPDEPESTKAVTGVPAVTTSKAHRISSTRPHTAQASSSPRSQTKQTLSSPRIKSESCHFFDDLLQVTPISPGRRQKQAWNADNKVTATSFDDLFEGQTKSEETKVNRKTETSKDARTAWAAGGQGDAEDVYKSNNYRGPRSRREDEDPLAGELMNAKNSTEVADNEQQTSTGRVRGPKVDAKKHRQELNKILQDDKHSDDSGYLEEQDEQDDAIELLEDADDLKREGVTNIPKSGYKLSKIMRQRQEEANVKLNINLYTGMQPQYSFTEDKYSSLQTNGSPLDSDPEERPDTGMSGYQPSPGDSDDDEFESVSQVTGPRRPVWNVMDSDGESFNLKVSKTLPEPSRSRKHKSSSSQRSKLAATAPVRFDDTAYPTRSLESADSFLQGRETLSGRPSEPKDVEASVQGSLRSDAGGWQLPRYESDTSLAEWQYEGKQKKQPPPKAY